MGWILACIDRVTHEHATNHAGGPATPRISLPIAMMPLGTGNDLARCFKWGAGYSGSMAKKNWLAKVARAKTARLDRWRLKIFPSQIAKAAEKKHLPPILSIHKVKTITTKFGYAGDPGDGSGAGAGANTTGSSAIPVVGNVVKVGAAEGAGVIHTKMLWRKFCLQMIFLMYFRCHAGGVRGANFEHSSPR